jgi:hypothetical protein
MRAPSEKGLEDPRLVPRAARVAHPIQQVVDLGFEVGAQRLPDLRAGRLLEVDEKNSR